MPAVTPVAACDQTPGDSGAGVVADTIPIGSYRRTATREDAVADGLDPGVVDEILGADGELTIVWRFDDGSWTESANDAGGDVFEVGDGGTYTYDEDGHLVTTSQSGGCRGCVGAMDWALTDDVLTMTLVPFEGHPGPYHDDEMLITNGDYARDAAT